MIQAQSADGVMHEFPDGTDMAVVDRAMSDYAMQQRFQQADKPSIPEDMAKGAASGVASGVAGTAGMRGSLGNLVARGGDAAVGWLADKMGAPVNRTAIQDAYRKANPSPSTEDVQRQIEAETGSQVAAGTYQPQTPYGRVAKTGGEFALGAVIPGSAPQRIAQVVVPTIGSEVGGAIGGPAGRAAGGFVGSLGPSMLGRTPYMERRLGQAAGSVTRQQFDDAAALAQDAQARDPGFRLSAAEVIQQAAPQARGLGTLQRISESAAGPDNALARMYSERPQAMARATEGALDQIAPRSTDADFLGQQVQRAAEQAGLGLERQRTAATTPHYAAAAADVVPEPQMRSILGGIDQAIASDPTGIVAGPLRELRDRLIAQPAQAGAPAQRTPVLGPNGQVVRYNHTPATPGTPEVPITDVGSLDRVRKYFRELPETGLDASTKDQRRLIAQYLDQIDQAMLAHSPELRTGRAIHQNLSETLVGPPMAGPLGNIGSTSKIDAQGRAFANPVSSPDAVRRDVGYIAAEDPNLARGLVREEMGRRADKTVGGLDNTGQPDQYGGAKFARALRGNPREAGNIGAAIETAAGPPVNEDVQRLVDALQATGNRQRPGSLTAFNEEAVSDAKKSGLRTLADAISTKPLAALEEGYGRFRMGSRMNNLAEILASGPEGVRQIQEAAGRGSDTARILARLLLAERAATQDRAH
jgi:hypothetical protein